MRRAARRTRGIIVSTAMPSACTSKRLQYSSLCAPEFKPSIARSKRKHQFPIRFREVLASEKSDIAHPDMDTVRSGNRMRRSEELKKRRREFERGPWPCSYECALYTSIAGLRDHVTPIHKKNFSWTSVISDFTDEAIAACAGERIRSQRAKKRRRTRDPTGSADLENVDVVMQHKDDVIDCDHFTSVHVIGGVG